MLEAGAMKAEATVPGLFRGRWRSTNPRTTALVEAMFLAGPDGPLLRLIGAGEGGAAIDWGAAPAAFFVDGPGQVAPTKLRASFDLGFMEVLIHGWVKQEVLVLAVFTRFADGDGRANHFDREFFYRADG